VQRVRVNGGRGLESLHVGKRRLEAFPQFSLEACLEGGRRFALPQTGQRAKGLDGCKSERIIVGGRSEVIAITNCAGARYVSKFKARCVDIDS
jgi:hypothetical protein